MRGEADYALANEWTTAMLERLQLERPACRCLAIEWSLWSGMGMGESLGRVDALMREGITPITPERGVEMLVRLLGRPLPAVAVVVTAESRRQRRARRAAAGADEPAQAEAA